MKLLVTGVNHKTAPVELREQLAIPGDRLAEATRTLLAHPGVSEAMILSTCNRVELVAAYELALPDMEAWFEQYFPGAVSALRPHLYQYRDAEAVRHLFRVASSLDSMVVGEPQILGQVKQSYTVARTLGAVRTQLDRLLQSAFSVAKKVRTETEIGSSSVSIASVGVDLARKIFGSLEGKRVLLVGAGKMSELAARHLMQHGATSFLVANRTHARAVELAQRFNGRALRFEDLHAMADQADIILTSTGSENFIFRREHGQQFLQRRKNRPMFFIDIAVPRDVDPEMNKVDGVFLYDIDDLQSVASSNMSDRSREARDAESIITLEVERFERRSASLDIVPALVVLQKAVEGMRQAELRKAASRLESLSPEQRAAVEAVTRGLANKFLHLPMQALKAAALEGDSATVEALREAFHLTGPEMGPEMGPVPAPSLPALAEEPALEVVVAGDKPSRGKG